MVSTGLVLRAVGLGVSFTCEGGKIVAWVGETGTVPGVAMGGKVKLVGLGIEFGAKGVWVGNIARVSKGPAVELGPTFEMIPRGLNEVDAVGDGTGTGVENPSGFDVVATEVVLIPIGLGVSAAGDGGKVVAAVGEAGTGAGVRTGEETMLLGTGVGGGTGGSKEPDVALGLIIELTPI